MDSGRVLQGIIVHYQFIFSCWRTYSRSCVHPTIVIMSCSDNTVITCNNIRQQKCHQDILITCYNCSAWPGFILDSSYCFGTLCSFALFLNISNHIRLLPGQLRPTQLGNDCWSSAGQTEAHHHCTIQSSAVDRRCSQFGPRRISKL